MQADKILKLVRLTEKSNKLSSELGQYTFEVHGHANKHQIAQAVEETFKVTVRRVNTMTYRGKNKKGGYIINGWRFACVDDLAGAGGYRHCNGSGKR